MLSISKSHFAAVLDPSSDIPTDLTIEVHDDKGKVTVFHAHKYYLALVSNVLRRRFFGSFRENSEVLIVRGTTAQAFESLINFVYHKGVKFKSNDVFDVANLAEMYDVKGLMVEVENAFKRVQINLKNVVLVASYAQKLSMFSSFNITEYLLTKCCNYLKKKLRTHVIDFSGLSYYSLRHKETVKLLHERILELPLSACQQCPQFVIDEHHNCPFDDLWDEEAEEDDDDEENNDERNYLHPFGIGHFGWW